MGLETATTIRSLLMRAWRERWTDVQWGIHLKTVSILVLANYMNVKVVIFDDQKIKA